MKVLFVDDEEAILSGLRRMLRRHAPGWETSFAVGGEAAISRLDDEHFDVVVTDMRMPGVDGAGVLEAVRDRHPGTVRIVLSGHNELAAALRTVPLAHQFLTKPCDPDELHSAVRRSTELQDALGRAELLPVIGGVDALPSPPAVIDQLGELLAAPEVDMNRVIDLVKADPAISAKLLQLVNSAFFGVARRVADVATAVRYLGVVTVRDLAVAVHAFRSMTGGKATRSLVEAIHLHSMEVATLTQLLVGEGRERHEAFMAALLHDVGRLVLTSRAGDAYAKVVDEASRTGRPLVDVEADELGATHAEVGALFLSMWGLPFPIVEVVLSHHAPRELREPLGTSDATYLAEMLVAARGSGLVLADGTAEVPAEAMDLPSVVRALERWQAERGEPA